MVKDYLIQDLSDYNVVIGDLQLQLKNGGLVLINGSLGAGKTTFISYFLSCYNFKQTASPTYAFHHRYQTEKICIDHFDLYRLETADELESIGFWDLLQENLSGISMIEWSSKVSDQDWPIDRTILHLDIQKVDELKRLVKLRF